MKTKLSDRDIVLAVYHILDGVEWSSSTLDEIANVLTDNGFIIRDPQECYDAVCPDCGGAALDDSGPHEPDCPRFKSYDEE